MFEQVNFKTKLQSKDYSWFLVNSYYTGITGFIVTSAGVLLLIYTLLTYKELPNLSPLLSELLGPFIMIFGGGAFQYLNGIYTYQKDSRTQETVTYKINQENLNLIGESFETKMSWDKMHKVKETKKHFHLYQTRMMANIIPKRELSLDEIVTLRELIKSIPNLKSKLLNN